MPMLRTSHFPNSTTPCGPGSSARAADRPSADQPRPHARPDRQRRGQRPEVRRRRSVPVPSAHRHRRHATTRSARWPTRSPRRASPSARSSRRSGPARSAAPRWAATRTARSLSLGREKACRIAKILNEHGVRKYGIIRIDSADGAGALGRGSRRATRRRSPRPFAKPRKSPRTTASAWRPRAKSAGPACTPGSDMLDLLERSRHARDRRLPGRPWPTPISTCSATTPPEHALLKPGYSVRPSSTRPTRR